LPARTWKLAAVLGTLTIAASAALAADWPNFGGNLANTASATTPGTSMALNQIGYLKTKWVFTTGGDVSARAAVVNGTVYFPDWGGNLWALDAQSGHLAWGHQIADYFGAPAGSMHSRTSPAVANGIVYIGTQEGAYLLAINASNGALVWKKQLESDDPYAIVTCSPAVSNGVVYTGVASLAEGGTLFHVDLSTSLARGSAVAVNASTGTIIWKTYTVPMGYTGGGVWGSSPVVDESRHRVYVGTGDNYTHPAGTAESVTGYPNYGACMAAPGANEASCLSPNDYVDSILALDTATGAVKWAKRLVTWSQPFINDGSDDWNVDCVFHASQCPSNPGPDYDFGSAPNEITYQTPSGPKTIIGAGQKSGIYYAMDPDTGAPLWQTPVGPGSSLGGMAT
jgi:polyvinyl alcohol dehydrogenase (cytochrome)